MKVVTAGDANSIDHALVKSRLGQMPQPLLDVLDQRDVSLVVCRDNVTNSGRDAFGEPPENWPKDKSWGDVPGCYVPASREVIIATTGTGDERRVPGHNERHGSFDLIFHEVMHADDIVLHENQWRWRSDNPRFIEAWRADIEAGGFENYVYESKLPREGYAESATRFFAGDSSLSHEWPHLDRFWRNADLPVDLGPLRSDARRSLEIEYSGMIGSVRVNAMGQYELDLVGRNASGVVGHAYLVLEQGDPAFEQVANQLAGRRDSALLSGEPVALMPF